MDKTDKKRFFDLYADELKNNILRFWLPRCEDKEFGGYLNCFDNKGKNLVSFDKYTWSQGRFLWMFSKLAVTQAPLFSDKQRSEFLRLADVGYSFLKNHCLMGKDDFRCVFLLNRDGSPKKVAGYDTLDMSIYADCFVIIGMAAYSIATSNANAYEFGKRLYISVCDRIEKGIFNTLPYPLSPQYRAHGIPMIMTNVAKELYCASLLHDKEFSGELLSDMDRTASDVLDNFMDDDYLIHEVISKDNSKIEGLLGQHINPGHSIEDSWFIYDASALLQKPEMAKKAARMMKASFEKGWDEEFGGVLHFVNLEGEPLVFESDSNEPTITLVKGGWGDKLWWEHSETLYASLLFYCLTDDKQYLTIHDRTLEYVKEHFINPDKSIGEWIQILTREGRAQEKVVALPVKDPFHITRNLLLICELLA